MEHIKKFAFYLVILNFSFVFSCKISGNNSGKCVSLQEVASQIPFCAEALSGSICVPHSHKLWPEFGIAYKDKLIHQKFMQKIEQTFTDEVYIKDAKDMYLITIKDCYTLYKQFVCNWNFPGCKVNNDGTETTLPVCMQLCVDYHNNCGLHQQLCNVNFNNEPGLDESNTACTPISSISS